MVATLQIPLEDLHRPEWQPRYVGDRKRYATASSVRFVDSRTLVCCSLLARKIYLIRFDLEGGRFEVLDRADTTYAGSTTETDLCDTDGRGHVITSNCETGGMSLYRRVGDKICFVRDLNPRLEGNFCHGARFLGPDVVVAAVLRNPVGAHFFDIQTMKKLLYIKTDRHLKDICFLPGNRAVLITTQSAPMLEKPRERHVSENLLVTFDLARKSWSLLKRQAYAVGQFDAAVVHGDRLFVVDGCRGVLVIDACTLQQVGLIEGIDVPHGIDVNYGMMAVASYGTNSIHVRTLDA